MAQRNYTRELKAEQAKGRVVVVSMQPYAGQEVAYLPRAASDPRPWAIKDQHGLDYEWRYSGRECHAVPACGVPFFGGKKCVLPSGHKEACSTR